MTSGKVKTKCIVCGKELEITLFENGEYSGGHYFGKMELPVGEGENRILGKKDIGGMEVEVFEWTGDHEEMEYWECDDCFNEE